MRRRPRLGDLVLACAVLVLAASAVAALRDAARHRDRSVATFTRAAKHRPGVITNASYRRAYRVIAVCGLHRPAAGAPVDHRVCGVIRGIGRHQRVGRWYTCRLGTRCAPPQPLPKAKRT